MKKIFQLVVIVCLIVLGTQAAFANADKETMMEGADITGIHRLAIGLPLYQQVDEKAPDKAKLTEIVYDASRVARCYVVSYDEVASRTLQAKGLDLKALERRQAAKEFKAVVADYADAYVILTVANNSRTTFFFDVFKAGTDELLYTYEIRANRSEGDSVDTFTTLSEQFYKHFENAAKTQQKENEKK